MKVFHITIERFRGFEALEVAPHGHVLLVGEPAQVSGLLTARPLSVTSAQWELKSRNIALAGVEPAVLEAELTQQDVNRLALILLRVAFAGCDIALPGRALSSPPRLRLVVSNDQWLKETLETVSSQLVRD